MNDAWKYIEAKFKASFGSKMVQEGVPCFVQKDNVRHPRKRTLHYCVKGVVVGFDRETRATIIEFKSRRQERYHLPDPRVHFNREDAEMGLRGKRVGGGGRASKPKVVEVVRKASTHKRRRIEGDDESSSSEEELLPKRVRPDASTHKRRRIEDDDELSSPEKEGAPAAAGDDEYSD